MLYKKAFDTLFSLLGILGLLVPFILIAVIVALTLRSNPIFLQRRIGYMSKSITVIKFKTLSDSKTDEGDLLPDEQRIYRLGSFLREYSIDELPQLINVFFGKMSLVGPRPLLAEYKGIFSAVENQRHLVKPGITGWSQINGRNAISWESRFNDDIWYVKNQSFSLDLRILWATVFVVIRKKGIRPEGQITLDRLDSRE